MSNELKGIGISDMEIAGIMGWRGPGAYTEATLRKIKRVLEEDRGRRTAPSAPMGEELPKWIDDHKGADPFMDDVIAYIESMQSQCAARIRQLERDLAERKTASIGDDPKFRELLYDVRALFIGDDREALRTLIAYIDGRPAGAAEAWIDVKDELPQPGERVLVSRYAGRVANDAHPGYPDNAWIEVSQIPERFAGFLCDLTSTGYVTHWKRVAAPTPMNSGKEEGNG
jgi:hypothetical protein